MSLPIYSQASPAAKTAVAVDLSNGDWISPPSGVLSVNPQPTSFLYAGTAGDLMVAFASRPDVVVPLRNFVAGYVQQLGIVRVYKAGTTASDIIALY